MMELKKLYVIETVNGEKKYFATQWDRNAALNRMTAYDHAHAKTYEITL